MLRIVYVQFQRGDNNTLKAYVDIQSPTLNSELLKINRNVYTLSVV